MPSVDDLLARARLRLDRVSAADLPAEVAAGALLVDIRPQAQREDAGECPGALVIERNVLEWRLDPAGDARIEAATDHDVRWILVCQQGYASSLAAASLQELGLHRATDLVGGYEALVAAETRR